MTQRIASGCVVALRYIMYNSNHYVLENIMQLPPVNYLQGSTGILYLLQQQLEGLQRGDKKKVQLVKGSGADDDFYFDVIIDDVRPASPEEIVLGYPLQIIVDACNENCSCYL